ncbi:DUF1120 domain-containing protein [Herbaspirillum chlorophenolicum]|uniref:DUF1120 domain-containing protein n=1 Tax=Herbaspirillum chlorophenolicum TaxID=211589 RepID=A0ABW8F4U1_9BURK
MKKWMTLIAASMALASVAVLAAPTTELKVGGTIKARACSFDIGNNGYITYDLIPSSQLKTGQYTALQEKSVDFAINCDAATALAIKVVDNRASSLVGGSEVGTAAGNVNDPHFVLYGLGTQDGKNIGAFRLRVPSVSVDGQPVSVLYGYLDWGSGGSAFYSYRGDIYKNYYTYFVNVGRTWAGKQYVGQMAVTPVLNKRELLPTSSDINLDGSVTFELFYR